MTRGRGCDRERPMGCPIMGATSVKGYYAATGHFRDGILLAPVTALVMTEV